MHKDKVWITVRCGFGDLITYLTRLPSVQKEYSGCDIVMCVDGYGQSPEWMREVCEACPQVSEVRVGWPTRKLMREEGAEEILNWVPEDAPLPFSMCLPYLVAAPDVVHIKIEEEFSLPWDRVLVMQPATTEGNNRGYELRRCWGERNWNYLSGKFIEEGWTVVWLGSEADKGYVAAPDEVVDLRGSLSILETISVIEHSFGCIAINSWIWEVAAYAGIPTVCIYLTDHHFIRLHVPPKGMENALVTIEDLDWAQMYEQVLDFFLFWFKRELPEILGSEIVDSEDSGEKMEGFEDEQDKYEHESERDASSA